MVEKREAEADRTASLFSPGDFVNQSTPQHVAIIMDGNRRWARSRGLPEVMGHRRGAAVVEALLPAVRAAGIETLTLFGFARANWERSRFEVDSLMRLAESSLDRYGPRCVREQIALEVIGRRDRLPVSLANAIDRVERATANGVRRLRIAFDYSSREAILEAARGLGESSAAADMGGCLGGGDVDLLIRTGREQRLSDFLLWECAFAELYFPDVYWPEFDAGELDRALDWFRQRERRFGR